MLYQRHVLDEQRASEYAWNTSERKYFASSSMSTCSLQYSLTSCRQPHTRYAWWRWWRRVGRGVIFFCVCVCACRWWRREGDAEAGEWLSSWKQIWYQLPPKRCDGLCFVECVWQPVPEDGHITAQWPCVWVVFCLGVSHRIQMSLFIHNPRWEEERREREGLYGRNRFL